MCRHRASTPAGSCWTGDARRGRLPGRVRSEPDTSRPDEQFPEQTPQEPATALSTGPPNMLSPSHVGEAPVSALQLRRAPLGVRAVVPPWPEKKPLEYLIWKNSRLAHPATFSGRKGPRSSVEGACVSVWTSGNPKGSREGSVPRDPPCIPNHAARSKSCTRSLSTASNKSFCSGAGGRAQTFSGIKGFIGLDYGKVLTHMLHKKQLFEFWQQWEEVWIMPVFAIGLLTQAAANPDPPIY